ncbi:MAG: hypothetical protein ACREAQ_09375, partial [Nitrososphaera sp.]
MSGKSRASPGRIMPPAAKAVEPSSPVSVAVRIPNIARIAKIIDSMTLSSNVKFSFLWRGLFEIVGVG